MESTGIEREIQQSCEKKAKTDQRQTHLSAEQLLKFLVEEQGEQGATLSECESIVQQVLDKRHHIARFTRHSLSLDDFHHFLFSTDLNPPMLSKVNHDMTAPLSHYFIYTGHNSYLTRNQLNSDCSNVPIIEALKRGVRVIELDLWPDSNSRKGAIQVKHGGGLKKFGMLAVALGIAGDTAVFYEVRIITLQGAESLIHSSSSVYNMAMVDEAVSYQNLASLNSTKTDRKILIRVTRLWLSISVEDQSFDGANLIFLD
ncbi:hypothetical protein ACET3Z_015587 [Daucus carota]